MRALALLVLGAALACAPASRAPVASPAVARDARAAIEHRTVADSIVVAGSLAYDWGTYRVRTESPAGETRETFGKYVIAWRETAPGVWRMHVDTWNSAPPAR